MPIEEGVYEALLTCGLAEEVAALRAAGRLAQTEDLGLEWVDDALSRHVAGLLRRSLAEIGDGGDAIARRTTLVGSVLEALGRVERPVVEPADWPTDAGEALTWVGPTEPGVAVPQAPPRPEHGLVQPSLLFNGAGDISLFHELQREIASAERIDAILAFLKFSGLQILKPALTRFAERRGTLRLVTSTYTGATEARAVEALVELGARVRIAWEEDGTRLHAKAWLFRRRSGLCTAYVGSSNLSRSALVDGAEWNVRVTRALTPAVVERFEQAFEQLWASLSDYHPAADGLRLREALRTPEGARLAVGIARPRVHQLRVLDALDAERAHGHTRNLIVAATGTGKTWTAAFDYQRLRSADGPRALLFVAHRKEILEQARQVYRTVLGDPDFGELLVDGEVPARGTHVFASVQSLRTWQGGLERYEIVVVDEFHHAAAQSYVDVLARVRPTVLLGLTATPERADGRDVLRYFDGRIAAELRLWEALDEGLVAPFHYFGVHDPTSAERAWVRGKLDAGALDRLYTGDDLRARRVLDAVGRYVADPLRMKAIGFCVGKGHAEIMARTFRDAGLAAEVLHSDVASSERAALLAKLADGRAQVLFTVDLLNEGVDVPAVDTVLFLRPTESATVFLQQLGRGLRRANGKSHLTVLDFVGHVHQDYRYDVRFRALLGGTRRDVALAVERDFPLLPSGCAMVLEPQARDVVLASVRRFVDAARWKGLVEDLRALPASTGLAEFLVRTDADLTDLYQPTGRTWGSLRREAGHEPSPEPEGEEAVRKRLARLLHVDDDARLLRWAEWLGSPAPPSAAEGGALVRMLFAALGNRRRPLAEMDAELGSIWSMTALRAEAVALLGVLLDRVRHRTYDSGLPVAVHGTYSRAEVVAAFGAEASGRLREIREGVMRVGGTHVLFVTLDKSADVFRPSIRYADYPLSATLFQWESQNHVHEGTAVGRAYVEHAARGEEVVLFVRERPKDGRGEAVPFVCLGRCRYVSHEGGRPMRIVWGLEQEMPASVLAARVVAA